jgi:hypothetical protein
MVCIREANVLPNSYPTTQQINVAHIAHLSLKERCILKPNILMMLLGTLSKFHWDISGKKYLMCRLGSSWENECEGLCENMQWSLYFKTLLNTLNLSLCVTYVTQELRRKNHPIFLKKIPHTIHHIKYMNSKIFAFLCALFTMCIKWTHIVMIKSAYLHISIHEPLHEF